MGFSVVVLSLLLVMVLVSSLAVGLNCMVPICYLRVVKMNHIYGNTTPLEGFRLIGGFEGFLTSGDFVVLRLK